MILFLVGIALGWTTTLTRIKGGTEEQRIRFRAALEVIPKCARSYGDGIKPRYEIRTLDSPSASHVTVPFRRPLIVIDPAFLGDPRRFDKVLEWEALIDGVPVRSLQDHREFLEDSDRVVLHEHAHWMQRKASTSIDFREYYRLGYEPKVAALRADPVTQELRDWMKSVDTETEWQAVLTTKAELAAAATEADRQTAAAAFAAARAACTEVLTAHGWPEAIRTFSRHLAKHGIPVRYWQDAHALNEDGDEYFAIVIAALVHDHQLFCDSQRPEEITWLKQNFGECLDQFQDTAPCYARAPTKPR